MPAQEEVMKSLETALVPGAMRSLVKMNLIRKENNYGYILRSQCYNTFRQFYW